MALKLLPRDSEHGWTPYVWLVYTGPYCAFPYFAGAAASAWAAQAAAYGVFLALYFRGYWVDGSRRVPIIIGIAGLGAALTPFNPGALIFFVFAAAFVTGARTGRAAAGWILGIGAVAAVVVLTMLSGPWPVAVAAGTALFSALVGFVNLHTHELRRRDASLKLAQQEVARLATAAERERIAGDLHDLLGHTLSVIVLKAALAAKLVARDPDRAAAEIGDVERVSREALVEVRGAVHGFRSAGLADELVRARAVLGTAQIRAEVDASALAQSSTPAVPRHVEHAIAMILREAVTNVIRHSGAARCLISVTRHANALQLRIEDDGVGQRVVEGAGIESMRARAREIGAALEHRAHRGVAVTVRVPLEEPT